MAVPSRSQALVAPVVCNLKPTREEGFDCRDCLTEFQPVFSRFTGMTCATSIITHFIEIFALSAVSGSACQ